MLVAGLILSNPALAAVELTAQQITEYESYDENIRIQLLIRLAKSGQHEEADVLLQRYPLQGKFAANRTIFIQGLIARGRGELREAATLFRKALANDPSLTLVRAELADTLYLLEDDDFAKHHLQLLMSAAPTPQEAQGVKSFIDTIDARRPYTISAFVSVAPSSNVNNGSANDTIYYNGIPFKIDPGSRMQSGIGLSAGVNAAYTWRLSQDYAAVFGAGVNGRLYKESDFNQFSLSQSAEIRYLHDFGHLGLGLVASQSLSGDAADLAYYGFGPRISMSQRLTKQDRIDASATLEFRTYPDYDNQNGIAYLSQGSWTHVFDPTLAISTGLSASRIDADDDFQDYWTYSASINAYKELQAGITANIGGEVRLTEYDRIVGDPRSDNRWTGTIALTKRDFDIMGYAPVIEYSYTRNNSNISLYEYDSHTVDFRLTKDF